MSKFRVGDRVKRVGKSNQGQNFIVRVGNIYTIKAISPTKMLKLKETPASWSYGNDPRYFIKIGGSMSKYDELKDRIEANRKAELGWGKEFDDILQEIPQNYYAICMTITNRQCATAVQIVHYDACHVLVKQYARYDYSSQCEKNTALHDAARWLLEHSDIKKDEKGDKIKALEESIKDIQRQIGALK